MDTWQKFEFTVRIGSALVALGISAGVGVIAKSQWRTSQEKLRLDLYGKRFEIYNRVFDAYDALLSWEDTSAQKDVVTQFYRAFRESRFLFPDSSGVYALLDEFAKHSAYIVNFRRLRDGLQGLPKDFGEAALVRSEHLSWILGSMEKLEPRMAPFLNFHKL